MKLNDKILIPTNIRPPKKKTRLWIDNEILEVYGKQLRAQGIAIYCVLARHANSKTQACFPSYPRIMKLSGVGNRNTITKYLNILEKLYLIYIIRNKKRQPNLYYLLSPKINSIESAKAQYLNSDIDSTKSDTLSHITKSNKEVEDFSIKKELGFSVNKYKPECLNNII